MPQPSNSVKTLTPSIKPSIAPSASASTPTPNELPWPWPSVPLAEGVTHRVKFPVGVTDNRLESSGPLAVFTEPKACDSRGPIWLADLAAGTVRKLYVPPVAVCIFEPAISGQTVAWLEAQGASTWRVMLLSLDASTPTTIATFRAPTERAGVIRLDDQAVAYVEPGPAGEGDTIHLLSWPGLHPIRTLHLSEGVFKLALVGTDLFWSQGAFTPAPQLSYYDTTGWLSTEADPTPRKVIDNAFELGFDGTWMVWVHDDCENGYCNRIYAMRTDQASPLVLTPMPQLGSPDLPFRSIWPSVGEGLAAWSIDGPKGSPLVVWPTGASTPVAVAETSTIAGTSIEDGWLVWNEGEGFGAAKVTDVLSAIASTGIH